MPSIFNNLRLHGHGASGSLTVGADEVAWVGRGGSAEGKKVATKSAAVARATWSVFGRWAVATLYNADGDVLLKLDGFARRDKDALAADLKAAGCALEGLEYSSAGVNRGKHFVEDEKRLVVEQTTGEGDAAKTRRLFELDLSKVSQCVMPSIGKNSTKELSLQFKEQRGGGSDEHQLVELRLWVPPGSRRVEEDGEAPPEGGEAKRLQGEITSAANLKAVTGDLLATFTPDQGNFLLPRGKYAVEMYSDFFRMHGNMYDYKISFSDVERFILLPRTDDVHYALILVLDRPIRQGQQRYGHLVWQLKKGETDLTVHLDEDAIAAKYGASSGLKPLLEGPLYQIAARVFKVMSGKKVFTTGKFRAADNRHAVNASVKANTGQLYPLERSFVFIHKPTIVVRFEDVASVEFERFSGYGQSSATKNFDVRVQTRGGGPEHLFSSIDRTEYKGLLEFLTAKGLKIRNLQETAAAETQARRQAMGLGDPGDSSDDEPAMGGIQDSNDEESVDEDFVAPKKGDDDDSDSDSDDGDDGSGGGGDDDGDGDDSGEEDEAPKPEKKKKKKKEHKEPKPEKKASKPKKRPAEDAPPAKKKKKAKKDPNAPKGKSSAFIFFGGSERAKIKEAHPDWSLGDIGRELGKRWNALDDAGKKPFQDLAAEDGERHKREMAAYQAKKAAEAEGGGGDDAMED
mmetsp:Transcript_16453/g.49540  ORF Transcript_16453/g.49540 Transcript_16453/m.49540 type:complete len:686 (-) Transcript_16453:49-2106(-)